MAETNDIWTGAALRYDETRPTPPPALLDLLTQLSGLPHPALVVDLGSGTGLSTAIWGERAELVIGIEPHAEMRAQAVHKVEGRPFATHITYQEGVAHRTGLPDACADLVTAAQAFHWMEPASALAEIARLLRPGGLFAAYDYDWPPAFNWELEQLYQNMDTRFDELLRERGLTGNPPQWPKHTHLDRMRDSGHFRFTRELLLHHIEQGDAARFLDLILTNGYGHRFKQKTVTAQEVGFDRLTRAAFQVLGFKPIPWYFSYRVRIAIK
jgi:SAM-dependent methyltransferase